MRLQAGDQAPDFELASDEGEQVLLSSLRGAPVVVYFYPRDDTPGCTRQACAIRDGHGSFAAAGARVFGISADDVASHARFRAKLSLPFPLLADPDHVVCEAYGVWVERPNGLMGIERSSFVIDRDGVLTQALYGVSPEETVPQTLAALAG